MFAWRTHTPLGRWAREAISDLGLSDFWVSEVSVPEGPRWTPPKIKVSRWKGATKGSVPPGDSARISREP